MFYSIGDSKLGIFFGIIILIYQYFYLSYFSIDKVKDKVVKSILNGFYRVNVLFFVSSLVFMLRFIVIIMGK